ncbi:S41 family peptidase [Candidatus Sumerlaeota bacterium]|nr:S41 family peptidase [Candidatus Sumerlaeota bacterium]
MEQMEHQERAERKHRRSQLEQSYPSRANEFLLFLNLLLMIVCAGLVLKAMGFQRLAAKEILPPLTDEQEEMYYRFSKTFGEVYNIIEARYIDAPEMDPKELFEGALQGMFNKLDEHSQYLSSQNFKSLTKETEGQFSGIGIVISQRDGLLTVISPIPGSPGAKAGLQPMDRIIEIDGESTEGITTIEAVDKLTGPQGTEVKIKVYRDGAPKTFDLTIIRQVIKVESVYWKILDDKIGYVRLTKFSKDISKDLRKALLEFNRDGCEGAIIDLRFNTGGLLEEAVNTSELFLDRGQLIVSVKGREESDYMERRSTQDSVYDKPIVVLVNKASASASEIFAGAMQDQRRGLVIGPVSDDNRTYGKGSVQTVERLNFPFETDENGNPMESAVRVTTAKWYTPSGHCIHENGILPDVLVDLPEGQTGDLLRYGVLLGDHYDENEVVNGKSVKEREGDDNGTEPSGDEGERTLEESEPTSGPASSGDENDPFYLKKLEKAEEAKESTEKKEKTWRDITDVQLDAAKKYLNVLVFMQQGPKEEKAP